MMKHKFNKLWCALAAVCMTFVRTSSKEQWTQKHTAIDAINGVHRKNVLQDAWK